MTVKLALPTGDIRSAVAAILREAGLPTDGYDPSSRLLRAHFADHGLAVRIFRERDIPVQIALGNYDAGICSAVWVLEESIRFPRQDLRLLGALPGPALGVWLAAAPASGLEPGTLPVPQPGLRLVSEFPNLADAVAVRLRWPVYRLFPLYGSAEAYPPEDADLALLAAPNAGEVERLGLVPLAEVARSPLVFVANRRALAAKDLSPLLAALRGQLREPPPGLVAPVGLPLRPMARCTRRSDVVRLALPDGHAQRHTFEALLAAGLSFDGYGEKTFVRRPRSDIEGLEVKVVRPQDMPAFVARGAFDAAVTGVDWLRDHLSRFPSSPVRMAVDLGRSRYKIGPVVDQAFPADTTADALPVWWGLGRPIRIASEYPALAEDFARRFHLPAAVIMPINGASEGFVPEDADILIEGSETGTSIRANGLKMLDPFLESTNCLIVREPALTSRTDLLDDLVAKLRAGLPASAGA
ncbi:ATP phosphoribosyltransferase [bacterium HR29]|jgi:ATP phosphoribosyltransferase|nr:ATP phosphoribosyltransferase [bacterium HR29]